MIQRQKKRDQLMVPLFFAFRSEKSSPFLLVISVRETINVGGSLSTLPVSGKKTTTNRLYFSRKGNPGHYVKKVNKIRIVGY